jgi:hypothetical protein
MLLATLIPIEDGLIVLRHHGPSRVAFGIHLGDGRIHADERRAAPSRLATHQINAVIITYG